MTPPVEKPLQVRTVFISSRMDELAMERHSAFSAIYEARLTPILFEMEPRTREREKIDALVDRADLFLGIYYQSMGRQNRQLCNLYPVEYELYRFLARFDICPAPESWALEAVDREWISKRMSDASYVEDLTKRLRSELRTESGRLYELMRSRVRLYLRVNRSDNLMTRSLVRFLDGMPKREFGAAEEMLPRVIAFLKEPRYVSPSMELFSKVADSISRAFARRSIECLKHVCKSILFLRVSGRDQPGLIFVILDVLFSNALNIKALDTRRVNSPEEKVEIFVAAEPFFQPVSASTLRNLVRFRLQDVARAAVYDVACSEVGRDYDRSPFAVREEDIPTSAFYFRILTFDVPGIIMSCARLVAHFEANIDFLHFEGGPYGYPALTLAIQPLSESSRAASDDGKTLQYELGSLLGVAKVFKISEEEARTSLVRPLAGAGAKRLRKKALPAARTEVAEPQRRRA